METRFIVERNERGTFCGDSWMIWDTTTGTIERCGIRSHKRAVMIATKWNNHCAALEHASQVAFTAEVEYYSSQFEHGR
jgi:hypothetical protein